MSKDIADIKTATGQLVYESSQRNINGGRFVERPELRLQPSDGGPEIIIRNSMMPAYLNNKLCEQLRQDHTQTITLHYVTGVHLKTGEARAGIFGAKAGQFQHCDTEFADLIKNEVSSEGFKLTMFMGGFCFLALALAFTIVGILIAIPMLLGLIPMWKPFKRASIMGRDWPNGAQAQVYFNTH